MNRKLKVFDYKFIIIIIVIVIIIKGGKWVMNEAEVDAFNIQQQEQGKTKFKEFYEILSGLKKIIT